MAMKFVKLTKPREEQKNDDFDIQNSIRVHGIGETLVESFRDQGKSELHELLNILEGNFSPYRLSYNETDNLTKYIMRKGEPSPRAFFMACTFFTAIVLFMMDSEFYKHGISFDGTTVFWLISIWSIWFISLIASRHGKKRRAKTVKCIEDGQYRAFLLPIDGQKRTYSRWGEIVYDYYIKSGEFVFETTGRETPISKGDNAVIIIIDGEKGLKELNTFNTEALRTGKFRENWNVLNPD